MNRKILLGLTTTPGSDWLEKIQEIERLQIDEVALFLTGMAQPERKKLYDLLEKSRLKNIPHVHLRDDMELWEVKYLEKRFNVQVFNIHNKKDAHPFNDFDKVFPEYTKKTYLENTESIPKPDELSQFGGLCIDFSHWEDGLLFNWEDYLNDSMKVIAEKFNTGCSHISAVGKKIAKEYDLSNPDVTYKNYSKHIFTKLSEFDYLKKFTPYFPELISLELENSFKEQLKAKKYIEKIIHEN